MQTLLISSGIDPTSESEYGEPPSVLCRRRFCLLCLQLVGAVSVPALSNKDSFSNQFRKQFFDSGRFDTEQFGKLRRFSLCVIGKIINDHHFLITGFQSDLFVAAFYRHLVYDKKMIRMIRNELQKLFFPYTKHRTPKGTVFFRNCLYLLHYPTRSEYFAPSSPV